LEDCQNSRVSEFSESSFHEFEELFLHFWAENLIGPLIVGEEQVLKISGIELIHFVLNPGIDLFP
jgi:hypothetical protein